MKTIKFVVGADGVVTCNGSRRAQKAGVQGDNKACTLEFDVSAVAKEKAKYFIECVLGNGTPLILSDESDGVRFADNVLSVVLDSTVSAQGGNVEIRVVQVTAIDEMYAEVVEENTYSCFIYFESKGLAMVREKLRAYGLFLELKEYAKNLQGDANNKYNEANSKLSAAIVAYENAMNALEQGVAINDEYFSFENGLLRLSHEYLESLSARFDEKQFAFELSPDQALEFSEGANGKPVLLLKSFGEIYQDADGLHVDIGDGLKRTDDGYRIEVDSDVIPDKEYVNSLMSGALKRKVCEDGLPKENIDINTVYMVPAEESAENNIYNEFMNINGAWEQIGSTAVDLSDYVLKSSVDKELSSESSNPVQNKAVAEALNEANAITRQMNEKINKNSNDLLELGEKKADKESWKLIETITCDGTKANYPRTGLNLSALKVVCSTEVGDKTYNGRLLINNLIFAFFSNYIGTSKKHMFATADLTNLSTQKGIGTTLTEVTAMENLEIVDYMLSMESITSYDFGSYTGTQLIPSGTVIKIYGKEK